MRRVIAAVVLLAAVSMRAEVFEVNRSDDDRLPGSLRWAIEQSNAIREGRDEIRLTGPLHIRPKSALPPLTAPALLTGSSERDVIIDGVDAGVANGIVGLASDVVISGIQVIRFNGAGIEVYGRGSVVAGCIARDNAGDGVVVGDGLVRDNIVDANQNGIRVEGYGTHVAGNVIGGETGNRENGIWVTATAREVVVGEVPFSAGIGSSAPYANRILRSGAHGILADGTGITVGANVIGSPGRGNGLHGLFARGRVHIAANDTSFNGRAGVAAMPWSYVASLHGCCNGGMLLDIRGDGPTPNDPGDLDDVTNAPRIITGIGSARAAWVMGELHARPLTRYRVELFSSYGSFMASVTLTTDGSGFSTFTAGAAGSPIDEISVAARRIDEGDSISELVPFRLQQQTDDRADIELRGALETVDTNRNVSIRLTVTNRGPGIVDDIHIPMPDPATAAGAGLAFETNRGVCSLAGRICKTGVLAPGESAELTMHFRLLPPLPYEYAFTASIVQPYTDPDLTDNTASIRIDRRESRRRAVGH